MPRDNHVNKAVPFRFVEQIEKTENAIRDKRRALYP